MNPADKDLHKFRTEIPNIVDDMEGLTVYAYRLYGRLKRVAGDSGVCWQSTDTLGKACSMSVGSVVRAKAELVERGLIDIVRVPNPHGGREYHEIRITNVWHENLARYATSSGELASSPDEVACSPDEVASSPGEVKKELFKKNSIKKIKGGGSKPKFDQLSMNEIRKIPEINTFIQVTGRYPGEAQLPIIFDVIHNYDLTVAGLNPYWQEWVSLGYRVQNLKWLTEWAVNGEIPKKYQSEQKNKVGEKPRTRMSQLLQEVINGDNG